MTYAAEKMAYEDNQDPRSLVLVVGCVEALERMWLPMDIENRELGDLLQVFLGGRIVIEVDIPFEVSCGPFRLGLRLNRHKT